MRGLAAGPHAGRNNHTTPRRRCTVPEGVSLACQPAPVTPAGASASSPRVGLSAHSSGRAPGDPASPEDTEQYHQMMQELLQRQRRAAMERQAAAGGAAPPPASPPPQAPAPPVRPPPPVSEGRGPGDGPPMRTPPGSPGWTQGPYQAQHPTQPASSPAHELDAAAHAPAPPLAPQPQSQPQSQPQLQPLPLPLQQQSQTQMPRQRAREASPRKPLPTLLSGLGTPTKAKPPSETAPSGRAAGVGLDILPATSQRAGPVAAADVNAGSAGGVVVGSTRSAKAAFAAPAPPSRRYGTGWDAPYLSRGTDTRSSGGGSGGAGGAGAGGLWANGSATRPVDGSSGPPMAQRTPLSLNSNMAHGSVSMTAARHPVAPAASAPPSVPAAAVASGSAAGGGAGTSVPTQSNAATAAGAANVADKPAAGSAAGSPAKPKSARRTALWLSSFVQASGRPGGLGAAVAGSAAAQAAAAAGTAASSKQPVQDAGARAAAMVRAAAARPARELADSVRDLPATIPELQARLEAAVQAEQESEMRALRALYASGSLRQLQREGVVLVGLLAAEEGRLYRSALWRFSMMPRHVPGGGGGGGGGMPQTLPYHKLRPGASVIITAHLADSGGGGGGGGGGGVTGVDAETGLPSGGVEGVVVEAQKDHLMVALEGRSHEAFQSMVSEVMRSGRSGGGARSGAAVSPAALAAGFLGWRLDQSVRDTTTRRHLEGIRRLGFWAEASEESRLGEARVRAVLAGSRLAALLAAEPPEWVTEERWREDARAALAAQQGLNDSQRRAVAAALTRTVTLWQGPPGTGKTRTLLALIEILVRVRAAGRGADSARAAARAPAPRAGRKAAAAAGSSPRADAMGPVLAVADTNAAVDNLVEGLAARGVAAVRLGPAAKARESLRHLSLEAQAEATPLGRKAVALRAQALKKQEQWREVGRPASGRDAGTAVAAAQAAEVKADLERAETALREAAAAVVASAEVVVSTCTAAGDSILDGRPWRCVVVDEASQATEPSVLVALTRGSAFVVMAGDPRQLPPTVLSEAALQYGLDVTLFERVAGAGGVTPLLLDTQYRMHPAISAFPSAFFYGGRLRDGVEAADKPAPAGFPWPLRSKPLALVQVTGGREETSGGVAELAATSAAASSAAGSGGGGGDGSAGPGTAMAAGRRGSPPKSADRASYRNPAEALLALAVTQQLLAAGDVTSAAILTPYRGQVRLIEALARQRGLEAVWSAAGQEVAVSTVDGYQGREADVVVFSAVRSNERGAVGFLSDARRMNVAITRPRRGLVVLADTETLTRGSADWRTYVKWARAQGVVVPDGDVIDVEAVLGRTRSVVATPSGGGLSSSDPSDTEDSTISPVTTTSTTGTTTTTTTSGRKGASRRKPQGGTSQEAAPGGETAGRVATEVDEEEEAAAAAAVLLVAKGTARRRGAKKAPAAASAAAAAAALKESSELEEAVPAGLPGTGSAAHDEAAPGAAAARSRTRLAPRPQAERGVAVGGKLVTRRARATKSGVSA